MTDAVFDYTPAEDQAFAANRALFLCIKENGLPISVATTEGWTEPEDDEFGCSYLQVYYDDTVGIPCLSGYIAIDPSDCTVRHYKSDSVAPRGTAVKVTATRYC